MEFYLSLTLLIITLIWILLYRKVKNLPPGPWGLPVVGYLPWIDPKQPYDTLNKLSEKYGSIYSLSMGSVFTVVLTDPQIIKEALARDVFTARANLYLTHGMMEGYGLIASEGERWKEQRRFIASFLRGLGMVKVGNKRAVMEERILVGLRDSIKMINDRVGERLEPFDILLHCMGNVMNSMIFGKTWKYEDEKWKLLRSLAKEGVKLIGVAGPINFLPFLRWWPGYRSTLRYLMEGKAFTHRLYKEIAVEKRTEESDDLLTVYKSAMAKGQGVYFQEAQMYHVLADMFGAGTDTTLTTLRWFLLFMATYPNIQAKIQEELEGVLKDRAEPCLEDMAFLPYTMACIAETQRIRPVVPLGIPHGTWEDTEINGYKIPKGTMLIVLQWSLHMNPKVWDNPEQFKPERFIDQEGKFIKKHDYSIPFQSGKRICPGEEMAKMMLFLFSAGILYNFDITVEEDGPELGKALEGECGITLGPDDHRLIFSHRGQSQPRPRHPTKRRVNSLE